MSRVRIATVAGEIERESLLAESLDYRGDVELVLRCLDRVELLAAIRGGRLDAIVIVGVPSWFDRQSVAEAAQQGVNIVALGETAPRGAHVVLDPDASLDEIVDACSAEPTIATMKDVGSGRRGRITAVWGPKGSPGRTRVALELAFALQRTDAAAIVLDADPYGGDVLQALNIVDEIPTVTWASRMAAKEELDEAAIESNLRKVPNGPVILPGLPRAELWPDVSEFGFGELLDVLRACFDHVIADAGFCLEPSSGIPGDGGEGRNRMARRLVGEADRVIAVCRADPIGVKNFLWAIEDLKLLTDLDKVVVVANRVGAGSERELAKLLDKHLGKRPVCYLPDRPEAMASALELGSSAAGSKGNGELRAAVEALAISVGARLKPRGVLTKLGGRR